MPWLLRHLQRKLNEATLDPTPANITKLSNAVRNWDPNTYMSTQPRLWQEANDILFQARVLLNMYDKGNA